MTGLGCIVLRRHAEVWMPHYANLSGKSHGLTPLGCYTQHVYAIPGCWGYRMGLRFRRSWSLVPGIRVNLGLRSGSVSFGVRGLHYTVGTSGSRITAGLPGTGLFWTKELNSPFASAHSGPWNQTQPPLPRVGGVGQAAQPFPQPAPVGPQTQISPRVAGATPTPP